jgi:hypothetical protein
MYSRILYTLICVRASVYLIVVMNSMYVSQMCTYI